ncbi:YjjW family glycine radical enzyme activase [Vibrio kasasachensis]|uniref:YjjW family glycine radical enzyme activase n=1 Tax=Vibrio kasasachensis TaxID=2910248 RepID=UPI003D143DDA
MSADSKRQGIVSRILNFSCVDGPGNRLVIFLQGCNFNCITCHNPHTINHCDHCGDCVAICPTNALSLDRQKRVIWENSLCTQCDQCLDACPRSSSPKITQYSVAGMIELIRKQHLFLAGITVSGGEATLQLPFIVELFKAIKLDTELSHLSCFIDSNGYLPASGWQRVLPYLDGAMIDLKSWQNETHQWLVGRDNHRVIQSIRLLAAQEKLHELRLLHIPGKSDLDEQVDALAALIHSLPAKVIIRLNAFQHHGVVGQALNWDKCSESQIEDFHQVLKAKIPNTIALPSVYL